MFVGRTGAAHDFQIQHAVEHFFVGQCFKARTCDDVAVGIFRFPGSDLTANLTGGTRSITGYDLYINTSIQTTLYGSRNICTDRVGDRNDSQIGQVGIMQAAIDEERFVLSVFNNLISKTECTHGLILIIQQLFFNISLAGIYRFISVVNGYTLAVCQYNFRCPFYVQHFFTQ